MEYATFVVGGLIFTDALFGLRMRHHKPAAQSDFLLDIVLAFALSSALGFVAVPTIGISWDFATHGNTLTLAMFKPYDERVIMGSLFIGTVALVVIAAWAYYERVPRDKDSEDDKDHKPAPE